MINIPFSLGDFFTCKWFCGAFSAELIRGGNPWAVFCGPRIKTFDNLDHGDDYENVQPVYQIGFLGFTLFEDHPEFCSWYQMRNKKDNHQIINFTFASGQSG